MMAVLKHFPKKIVCLFLLLLLGNQAMAAKKDKAAKLQETKSYGLVLQTPSKLWLEGASTLHSFSATATKISITASLLLPADPGQWGTALELGGLKALELRLPVQGLKSGEDGLDKNMYHSLKAEANPDIFFVLDHYQIVDNMGASLAATVSGFLNIAGKAQKLEMELSLGLQPGTLALDGEQKVPMTDFGVDPPVFMLGALRVGNQVIVRFHLVLGIEAEGPKP